MTLGCPPRRLLFGLVAVLCLAWPSAAPTQRPSAAQDLPPPRGLPRPERLSLDGSAAATARALAARDPGEASAAVALSDLPWLRATSGLLALADQGEPRRDLAFPRRTPLVMAGQAYTKGIGTLPLSEIEYRLPPDAAAFRAVVGLNDLPAIDAGSVVFHVYGDDVELYASGVIRRGDAPQTIRVGLAGVERLRLVVTDAGDGPVGDYADWADATLELGQPPADGGALAEAIAADRAARRRNVQGEEGRLRELAAAELLVADRVLDALGQDDPGSLPAGLQPSDQRGGILLAGERSQTSRGAPVLQVADVRAGWDEARGLLLLSNAALLLTIGMGGEEHGYLSAVDRRTGRLLFYDTTPAVQLAGGPIWRLHGDTVPDGPQPHELAEREDPALGRAVEVAARYRLPDGAGRVVLRVSLFADQAYFTSQLAGESLPPGGQVQRYAYFADADAGGFVVGGDGAYLADRSRLWEAPLLDDGYERQATLEATKPLLLWNGPNQALLATALDCVDAPASLAFRREPGRAAASVVASHDDVLGERPSVSPRLLVESLTSGELRRAFASYRRIMDRLYPAVAAPPWLRHQLGSWYAFGPGVDDARMRQQIDYIAANLNDLGPWHVVIDAGWHVAYGQADAEFRAVDYDKFPQGIRALVDYAHARGIRVVLYLPTGYVHDGRGDGEWLALPELIQAHPDWLTPIYTNGDVGRFLLDYRRPDVRAHVARTLEEALVGFDADGISIDGLADAEGQLVPLPLRQTWRGAAPIQRSHVIYELFGREIFERKPDAYVETGWITPTCSRPYATTFRYADESNVFTNPYPFGGFATHLDYAIYQTLLGQRANMGANFGDPNRSDALTWLQGALALGVQATLSFDLTTMSPETLARYRAHLAHYQPFAGDTRFDAASPPVSFATRRGPFAYLGIVNREPERRAITVSLPELGLDDATAYAAYDPDRGPLPPVSDGFTALLEPRSFRLVVLRREPGVLWTASAFEERRTADGLAVQVGGPATIPGLLWLASPPPTAVLLDGAPLAPLGAGGGDGYRYDPTSGVLQVRYAHTDTREVTVRFADAEGSGG